MFLVWMVCVIMLHSKLTSAGDLHSNMLPNASILSQDSNIWNQSSTEHVDTYNSSAIPSNSLNSYVVSSKNLNFSFNPPELNHLQIEAQQLVHINCSSCNIMDIVGDSRTSALITSAHHSPPNITFLITVSSEDETVAVPTKLPGAELSLSDANRTHKVDVLLNSSMEGSFYVHAVNIGRSSMIIQVSGPIIVAPSYKEANNTSDPELQPTTSYVLPSDVMLYYRVTVIRRVRSVDLVFKYVIASTALLFSFSMGCATDVVSLKTHFKSPATLLMGLVCQFGLMPLVAMAISFAFHLGKEQSLGLFFTACVPGGGGGHILVTIIKGNRSLSMSMNFLSTLVATGMAPMWIFVMGPFLGLEQSQLFPVVEFAIWLSGSTFVSLLGLLLRYLEVKAAEAFLNWFIKPFLLLYVILFITLGMYINIYMLSLTTSKSFIAAGMIPMLGYLFGVVGANMFKQDLKNLKTIATETTVSNSILVIAMIRFSFKQPDADITAVLPIWVLYTSPLPLIIYSLIQRIRSFALRQKEKRKQRKYRNFSIASSLMNMTNVTMLSSTATPRMNSPTDDNTTLIDEKVTVV